MVAVRQSGQSAATVASVSADSLDSLYSPLPSDAVNYVLKSKSCESEGGGQPQIQTAKNMLLMLQRAHGWTSERFFLFVCFFLSAHTKVVVAAVSLLPRLPPSPVGAQWEPWQQATVSQ